MKLFFVSVFLFFSCAISVFAQIDTSFYLAQYPTGQEGLVRDIEAFSKITEEDKEQLEGKEIQITFLISKSGLVKEGYVKGIDSDDLKERLEHSIMQLHDFIPARSKGENVESTYHTVLSFNDYFPQPIFLRDLSKYIEKSGGWSLEFGGYIGDFMGEISDVYGMNGGFVTSTGVVFDNNLINFDFGIGGAQKKKDFVLPDNVVEESNDAHFYYGMSYSRFFPVNKNQSFRTKIGVGGYSINAGFISEGNLFRFGGFDSYGELSYAIKVSQSTSVSYFNVSRFKHYISPFVQLHKWIGDDQSEGFFYNVGIKYSLEIFGMKST